MVYNSKNRVATTVISLEEMIKRSKAREASVDIKRVIFVGDINLCYLIDNPLDVTDPLNFRFIYVERIHFYKGTLVIHNIKADPCNCEIANIGSSRVIEFARIFLKEKKNEIFCPQLIVHYDDRKNTCYSSIDDLYDLFNVDKERGYIVDYVDIEVSDQTGYIGINVYVKD